MSYDIYIGEAKIDVPDADMLDDGYNELGCEVAGMALDDAPQFPGDFMTKNGNSRHPGYGAWREFLRTAGIEPLFLDKESGLMRAHPGCFMLAKHHSEAIGEALARWKREHPTAKPGWCGCVDCDRLSAREEKPKHEELDGVLARLIWLDFWVRWALKNCKVPAIYNH